MNMISPYRIPTNITNKRSKKVSNTNLDNMSHREHDLKGPQITSNEPVKKAIKRKVVQILKLMMNI